MSFFTNLLNLKKNGKLPGIPAISQRGLLYIHTEALLAPWMRKFYDHAGPRVFVKRSDIVAFLKKQPGFIEIGFAKRIGNRVYRCVVFRESEAPRELRRLVDGQRMDQRNKAT